MGYRISEKETLLKLFTCFIKTKVRNKKINFGFSLNFEGGSKSRYKTKYIENGYSSIVIHHDA